MMANGKVFKTGSVDEWMDCGNKNVTVEKFKNARFLASRWIAMVSKTLKSENSTIIAPCSLTMMWF
jgi:glucose-1-phosphate thymidylyltransferase